MCKTPRKRQQLLCHHFPLIPCSLSLIRSAWMFLPFLVWSPARRPCPPSFPCPSAPSPSRSPFFLDPLIGSELRCMRWTLWRWPGCWWEAGARWSFLRRRISRLARSGGICMSGSRAFLCFLRGSCLGSRLGWCRLDWLSLRSFSAVERPLRSSRQVCGFSCVDSWIDLLGFKIWNF